MEIFDNHTHKHIQNKEANQQNKRNKVEQSPLVVINNRLKRNIFFVLFPIHRTEVDQKNNLPAYLRQLNLSQYT